MANIFHQLRELQRRSTAMKVRLEPVPTVSPCDIDGYVAQSRVKRRKGTWIRRLSDKGNFSYAGDFLYLLSYPLMRNTGGSDT